MKLETDGHSYDILERAVVSVADLPGLFCEIGTRRGGSLQIIVDAAIGSMQNRTVISVDPYGDIPYNDGKEIRRYDYTNQMKGEAMAAIWNYLKGKPVNFIPFCLTDAAFMEYFAAGVPVYDHEPALYYWYAFAFLDGPHDMRSIGDELRFFGKRMRRGAAIVIDNIEYHPDLTPLLSVAENAGFKEVERNNQKIRLCRR